MATTPDVFQLIQNIGAMVAPFMSLITGASYVAGVWFMLLAVYSFKKVADYRSAMYHPVEFKGPVLQLLTGMMLLYLPLVFQAFSQTTFGDNSSILRYQDNNSGTNFDDAIAVCFNIVSLIGVIAFILLIQNTLGISILS